MQQEQGIRYKMYNFSFHLHLKLKHYIICMDRKFNPALISYTKFKPQNGNIKESVYKYDKPTHLTLLMSDLGAGKTAACWLPLQSWQQPSAAMWNTRLYPHLAYPSETQVKTKCITCL